MWDRGTALTEAPPEMATALGQAEHGGTGGLIKNTAPFQQLRPGPKWNCAQERGSEERPDCIILSRLRAKVPAELSKKLNPEKNSHHPLQQTNKKKA